MRLLYVIDSLAPGGAETSLAAMAPHWVRSGIDLHVLPLGDRWDLSASITDSGGTIHRIHAGPGRVGNVRAIRERIHALRPDLVHTTLFEADVTGRAAARLARVPCSTSLVNDSYGPAHCAEAPRSRLALAHAADAATAPFARRFHAISTAVATAMAQRLHVPHDRIDVIPRGRDGSRFSGPTAPARAAIRAELDLDASTPVVLAIGRLEPQKGMKDLVDAMATVVQTHPGAVALIAGKDGRETAALRTQALDLGLDVRFLGHRTDVPDLLAAADVFCFPSLREGFGGVLIEAMAAGSPVVASAIPTTVEVLSHRGQVAGLLTPPGDSRALAQGITESLGNRHASRERVELGREAFAVRYEIAPVSAAMVRFFEQAAG